MTPINLPGVKQGILTPGFFGKKYFPIQREHGRIQGLPKFLEYPVLSQERVELQTSNLACVFTGSLRTKAPENWGEKAAWAYPGTVQIF